MRPGIEHDSAETRPRKSSVTASPLVSSDRRTSQPTTFFLARESDIPTLQSDRNAPMQTSMPPVSSLQETIQEADLAPRIAAPRPSSGEPRSGSRRRSTIRPYTSCERLRQGTSSALPESSAAVPDRTVTPSPLPSDVSLSSSPRSTSSRSIRKSDDELTSDETGSQAIVSSGDEDEDPPAVVQDSQPELIMPSIKMPSRRPFTLRGRQLGRFKMLVAGRKGAGKTSLIKSIVQLCEDIVHVDPVSHLLSPDTSRRDPGGLVESVSEIYASTKPYPAWWSNLEESRILRRRKSVGDSVLERNVCFVDTSDVVKLDKIVRYVETQLMQAMSSVDQLGSEFSGMLSGRGSSQVDVILYLMTKDHLTDDCDRIRQLSELCNVIPLIAKSDLLSPDVQEAMKKQAPDLGAIVLPTLPASLTHDLEPPTIATAPYTVTSINGPDLDTMDASLLMSPEYVQPLLPSELAPLVLQLFEPDTVAFLRHTSARKLLAWHSTHPRLSPPSPSLPSVHNSSLVSPFPTTSLSNSGVLVPTASEASLNTSNSWALAKIADHTQREERLAQVRLSKWASELQLSLQRERERYERVARSERAMWLVEKMGDEVRDGRVIPMIEHQRADDQRLVHRGRGKSGGGLEYADIPTYVMHDPLGLLRWGDTMRTRGWIALQLLGSFGVAGGVAFWLAKTWGLTDGFLEWINRMYGQWFGSE